MISVHAYHDGTKHHFDRFARSLGYLDWASQPNPFRSFGGARHIALYPRPDAAPLDSTLGASPPVARPFSAADVGDLLRHSLGLSAWKRFRDSKWSLRVNPSSGNLHPTEAYVVCGPRTGLDRDAGVYHYAPETHALEQRCAFGADVWPEAVGSDAVLLVALTSIHWREAWKYGERAFRYCQHDLGHAIAAIRIAASLVGGTAALLPEWPQRDIATLAGIDRDDDYVDAEREEAGCLIVVGRQSTVDSRQARRLDRHSLVESVRAGQWTGRANQLSDDHVQWTFIDEIARATEDRGRAAATRSPADAGAPPPARTDADASARRYMPSPQRGRRRSEIEDSAHPAHVAYPADVILQRRSALGFDGRSSIDGDRFVAMLARVMPSEQPPWDALWWDARVHLALFVHRVDGFEPGLYLLVRNPRTFDALKGAIARDFAWTRATEALPLFLLARGDCRRLAQRLSCDQEIAGDGFFSLGMIAEFDASLEALGPSFYRHLFWESGVVGQVLYLEAEAAGARATGIGCFYDDPVHDVLGLTGHTFQSLYHFTAGMPVEDTRLTTEPGYAWEGSQERAGR